MSDDVPVLETERLILRGHRSTTFPPTPRCGPIPASPASSAARRCREEDAWAKFLRAFGQWALMGFGFWSVDREGQRQARRRSRLSRRQARHRSVARGHPGMRLGLRPSGARQGLRDRSGARRACLGRCAISARCAWPASSRRKIRRRCSVAEKTGFREATRTTYKD